MTEVVVVTPADEPEAAETACCEHCEANRAAIATLIEAQAAAAEMSEDAALEAVAELLELEEIADEPSGPSTEPDI